MRTRQAAVAARRFLVPALLGGVLAALLAGCGIRPTSVPVDAGSAPSRARCGVKPPPVPREDARLRDVFLVCGPKLALVRRKLEQTAPGAGEQRTAHEELLHYLTTELTPSERADGYTTQVERIAVLPPHRGDPARAVRFDHDPEQLSKEGLAQLVCTFAALSDDRKALLGTAGRLRTYTCTSEVRDLDQP
ncbi:hypothetical protein ACFQLX_03995 [Streptomyces polyrhachis]|uniref:Lipoprotein n=1 Tax=Streptomyces polyrhachis TaxID=1282885 RepID=A0ABW2GC93_9ACTN